VQRIHRAPMESSPSPVENFLRLTISRANFGERARKSPFKYVIKFLSTGRFFDAHKRRVGVPDITACTHLCSNYRVLSIKAREYNRSARETAFDSHSRSVFSIKHAYPISLHRVNHCWILNSEPLFRSATIEIIAFANRSCSPAMPK